jgi:hypothetical protein
MVRQGGSRAIAGHFCEPGSASASPSRGHLVRVRSFSWSSCGENEMRHENENLMSPDLLSEIVLLGSALVLFASVLLIVVTALARA